MSIEIYAVKDGVVQYRESDDQSEGFKRYPAAPEIFQYPGGEYSLRNFPFEHDNVLWVALVRGADPADLIKAALLGDYARRANFTKRNDDRFVLALPYLPAARADKGSPRGAAVYADFIHAVHADYVITLDPHSSFMPSRLGNIVDLQPTDFIERAVLSVMLGDRRVPYDAVIAPDKGAKERADHAARRLGVDVYQCEKTRDFDTGKILDIKAPPDLPTTGRYLVVDDICDGGGTFIRLAEVLGIPRERLDLWVTHGIFSGKPYILSHHYGDVFTTDSHPGARGVGQASHVEPVWEKMIQAARRAPRK